MIVLALNDTIINGMNNPDCAFFVGQTMGQADLLGKIVVLMLVFTAYEFAKKLVVEPLIQKIKKKFKIGVDKE